MHLLNLRKLQKKMFIHSYELWYHYFTKSWEKWYQLTQQLTKVTITARFKLKNRGTFHMIFNRFKPVAKRSHKSAQHFGTKIMKGSKKFSTLRNLFFLKKPSFKSKILHFIEFVYFFGCINHCQNPERIFLSL